MRKILIAATALLAITSSAFAGDFSAPAMNVQGQSTPVDVPGQSTPVLLAYDIPAGPIWNQADAQAKCPKVCEPFGGWNGNWATTRPGQMSVCGCKIEMGTKCG